MNDFKKANKYYFYLTKRLFSFSKDNFKLLEKKPYLFVCNKFDRHPKLSSICSLDTVFNISLKKIKIDSNLFNSFDRSQEYAYMIGNFLKGNNRFKYTTIVHILMTLFKYSIKLFFSIFDIIFTISYSLIYINIIRNLSAKIEVLWGESNLYTYNYWKSKGLGSIKYYYPDRNLYQNNYFIATEFPEYTFISNALCKYHKEKHKKILTFLNFINNKDLIEAIYFLAETCIYDFFSKSKKSYGFYVNNIIKLSFLNRRFLFILNYQCTKHIIKNYKFKSIYIWSENQNDTKIFSVGLNKFKERNIQPRLISYIGCSLFSSWHHIQFIPNQLELEIGGWGDKIFMLPDQESINEFKLALEKKFKKNEFQYIKINKRLKRFESNIYEYKNKKQKKRNFTYIMHGSDNEFLLVLLTLLNTKHIFKEISKSPLYIRKHPSVSIKEIKYFLFILKKDFGASFPQIIFIENNKENIIESIQKTNYCIFGDSSFINMSLSSGIKTISVRTSFLYNPPIQRKFFNHKKLYSI